MLEFSSYLWLRLIIYNCVFDLECCEYYDKLRFLVLLWLKLIKKGAVKKKSKWAQNAIF